MTLPPNRRSTDTPLGDTARILAIVYTVGYFAVVFIVILKGIPAESKDIILQLVGILSIIQTGIVSFYFGGSKSKERSDVVMQEIAKAPIVASAIAADKSSGNNSGDVK